MLIEDRVYAMSAPIRDCAAAIDSARVMAYITGKPHTLYLDISDKGHRWHVRAIDDIPMGDGSAHWVRAGGIYEPGEQRSGIGTNPELIPELAEARGVSPFVHLDTLRAEYRRFEIGGRARPRND